MDNISIQDLISSAIILVGVGGFIYWLACTEMGTRALVGSRVRRNGVGIYVPFILVVGWFIVVAAEVSAVYYLFDLEEPAIKSAAVNILMCINGIGLTVAIVFIARRYFVRGLKGFGLLGQNVVKDAGAATVNMVCVFPLVMAAVAATIYIGGWLYGEDFNFGEHSELTMLKESGEWWVRAVIFATAVVFVPIFEEALFRGLTQSVIRSYVLKPWLAIFATAMLFAIAHQDVAHWPALIVLGIALGYSYEKSGSLYRPIFIHMLFNGMSLVSTLVENSG